VKHSDHEKAEIVELAVDLKSTIDSDNRQVASDILLKSKTGVN